MNSKTVCAAEPIRALGRELWRDGLALLYPPRCALCGVRADGGACARHAIAAVGSAACSLAGERCGRCARRLPRGLPDGETCAECRRHPPAFRRVLALADYRGGPGNTAASADARAWVMALKYGARPDLAVWLGAALWLRLAGERSREWQGALLVPVPLHRWRRLERGYDQARLLARGVEQAGGPPVLAALRRTRATAPQGAPGSSSRRANVRAAFALARGAAAPLRGTPVWLVDDVVASGSTADACARILRRAGAAAVGVLAVARGAARAGD